MNYLEGTTDRQAQAITAEGEALAITAGAGAGKTAVLTRMVYHRLQKYVNITNLKTPIVSITFTRDAATEMKNRIKLMTGKQLSDRVISTTFHQFAINYILKPHFHLPFFKKMGFRRWKIASPRDVFFHLNQATDSALTNSQTRDYKALDKTLELKEWLSLVRAFGHSPETYFAQNKAGFHGVAKTFQDLIDYNEVPHALNETQRRNFYCLKIWYSYVQINRSPQNSLIDLDEILVLATHLLEQVPEIRKKLKQQFRELLIDEFQDSNHCQYRFVIALAGKGEGLAIFGDVKQAIYGFRGSDPKLFGELMRLFPAHKQINLPDNFRSAQQIVTVGNTLADKMSLKMTSEPMIARNPAIPHEPVVFQELDYPACEAEWIATKMQWLKDRGIPYHKMGVLYRFRKLGDALENELLARNMPVRRVGGADDKSLYEDERIIDIVLFLHLLFNPSSKKAMRFFVSSHSSFGLSTAEYNALLQKNSFGENHHKAISYFTNSHYNQNEPAWGVFNSIAQALFDLSARLERIRTFDNYCRHRNVQFNGLAPNQKDKVRGQLGESYQMAVSDFIGRIRQYYCQSFFIPFATQQSRANALQRHQDRINEDFDSIFSYVMNPTRLVHDEMDILDYLRNRPLMIDKSKKQREENTTDVELMTIHASKGLEKEAIFIIGCSNETWFKDRKLPASGSLNYEEELRLKYVAVTRARLQLYITRHRAYKYRNDFIETEMLDFLRHIIELPEVRVNDLQQAG
ncbi:putative ATP-dependent DNA helicase Rep [Vibrio nigripulchritudo SOn1]|uniref:DNA 3'-5' helicase n=1 Tax=Vibrio nigripulchritudo SOn1 TaxID=1238450 RepID=A0AAV2VPZ4_9VIBR|nr:ATP-dependent helicase [Vibrio nigripulchritudo]CCO46788.1 putative ATP-dependent DNA helicase Rep [Vibrio nigripulchritudo SOn1]